MRSSVRRDSYALAKTIAIFNYQSTAQAATPTHAPSAPLPQTANICPAMILQVCGVNFGTPPNILDTFETFTMPDQFISNSVTFQCISDGYHVYYKIADNTVALCALKTCKPGLVSVCVTETLPVQADIFVGASTKLTIPSTLLAQNNQLPVPDLSEQCVVDERLPTYELGDDSALSCNVFTCQAKELSTYDTTIVVPGPSDLGTVLQVKTNDNRVATVECMGTEGLAPQYTVVDQNCN